MSLNRNPETWQVFIPKSDNLTSEWGGHEKQERWGKLSLLALERCEAWLQTDKQPKSLQDIYYFLADERFKIARVLDHKIEYGIRRVDESMRSPFNAIRLRTKSQFQEMKDRFLAMANEDDSVVYKKILNSEEKEILKLSFSASEDTLYVDYPYLDTSTELIEEANQIWLETYARKDELSPAEKYLQLGKILWNLALARPLQFGSASVSEYLYHVLTKQLGLPLAAVDCGNKTWDVWAMMHPTPDDYAIWFCNRVMESLSKNPCFELQPLVGVDNTVIITSEANKLADLVLSDSISVDSPYQTNLTDPYGFSLFHHFMMTIMKKSSDSCTYYEQKRAIKMAYQMLPNRQVLFFEAVLQGSNTVDPVIFIMNIYKTKHFSTEDVDRQLKEMTDITMILRDCLPSHYKDLNLPNEWKRDMSLSYFDYMIAMTVNPEIHRLATKHKNTLQTIPLDSEKDFFNQSRDAIDRNDSKTLIKLIEEEKPFNDEQLMKLIETREIDSYFTGFSIEDWLRPCVAGKSLLDNVVTYENTKVLTCILKACTTQQEINKLMDYATVNFNTKLDFFFCGLLNTYINTTLVTHVKTWLDQHPEINLLSIVLTNTTHLHHKLNSILPALFSDISSTRLNAPCGNYSTLECALQVGEIVMKVYALEYLADRGMNITLASPIDIILLNHITHYVFFSKNIEPCRQICRQLSPKNIEEVISTLFYPPDPESILNFCKILNELANAETAQHPTLFSSKTSIAELRNAVTAGIVGYLKNNRNYPDINLLKNCFTHLEFLDREDLQTCREKLLESYHPELGQIFQIIDDKLKLLIVPFKK